LEVAHDFSTTLFSKRQRTTNDIIHRDILEGNKTFYNDCGIQLHAVGVHSIASKDPSALRKQEALEALIVGNAQLYFTPQDVDLTIRTG